MALSSEQLAWIAEIVRESKADVEAAIVARPLDAAQELILGDDIDTWEAERDSVDVRLKGGSGGVDLNTDRLLAKIFYRTRRMLGFPEIPYDQDEVVMSLIELEVGQNF